MRLVMFFLWVMILAACNMGDSVECNILTNSDVESGIPDPTAWGSIVLGAAMSAYDGTVARSTSHSLKISCAVVEGATWGYWIQTINTDIPFGKRLTLRVHIKGENLSGEGVSIAARCDDAGGQLLFNSTEGEIAIVDTFDWTCFEVALNDVVPAETTVTYVYLILLPNTTGTVYFDDISLYYKE